MCEILKTKNSVITARIVRSGPWIFFIAMFDVTLIFLNIKGDVVVLMDDRRQHEFCIS